MIISFVNYELRVRIENKDVEEMGRQHQAQNQFFEEQDAMWREMAAKNAVIGTPVEEPKREEEEPIQE